MGKVVKGKTKKKKGRPSLLDLQKRSLKEQQQYLLLQNQIQNQTKKPTNPNYGTTPITTPLRRSSRRNPNQDDDPHSSDFDSGDDEEGGEELNRKGREKKLKLVLKFPPNSRSFDSYASDSNGEDDGVASNHKKRKISAIRDGSVRGDAEKGENVASGANSVQGSQVNGGSVTPLPDKKLLLFILDRLQKKDTYGVFSEPVDPNELPDYHEVIEHPIDFGTIRKKLAGVAYTNLEQFEKDVVLLCSNAMQYNAPDTIYFRQARSIKELAKRDFENLRRESDAEDPEPKIVRRGRPPTKNLKKVLGRHLDRTGSEFSSDATLATGGDNALSNNDPRKGSARPEKFIFANSSARSRNTETYAGLELRKDRNDESMGMTYATLSKGISMKHWKKHIVPDENKRNTYKLYHPSGCDREPPIFTTFDGERRMLMAVGLHSEHGYARSLARFAASLGPIAWKIASEKIQRSLPPGIDFRPGWVGEDEGQLHRLPVVPSPTPSHPSKPLSPPKSSLPSYNNVESKGDNPLDKSELGNSSLLENPSTDDQSIKHLSTTSYRSPEAGKGVPETSEGLISSSRYNAMNSSVGGSRPQPPFQFNHTRPGINGFSGAYGLPVPSQMRKMVGPTSSGCSRPGNNFIRPDSVCLNGSSSEALELVDNSAAPTNPVRSSKELQPHPSWQELLSRQKTDSVPPDLNERFQSPGSPSSSSRVDSIHPDLVLQL